MAKKNEYGLTVQQEAFATAIASGESQAEAYRIAYPRSRNWKDEVVWAAASKLAANSKVCIRVKGLQEAACKKNQITVERVTAELAKMAFFDVRKLFNGDGSPKSIQDLDDETAAAVAGIDVANVGNAEIGIGQVLKLKLADKRASLELLGKHLQMFPTTVNVGGQKDNPLEITQEIKTRIVIVPEKDKAVIETKAVVKSGDLDA